MLIFVAIALASFVIIAGSFLFGHDIDHDVDHDVGHDHDMGGDGTISIFSTKVLGTMCMGFGAAGAIARYYDASYPTASVSGVVFGGLLGAAMYVFLRAITAQQASSLISTETLVGKTGTVTVPIDADGVGEVGISTGSQYVNYPARSRSGSAIPKGRTIRVVQSAGAQLIVEETRNP
jgi:membrane protein implicated in regulation of membrane protease activity